MANRRPDTSKYGQFSFSKNQIRFLPPDVQKKAELELKEVPPSKLIEQVQEFREKVLNEPCLKANTSDAYLLRFLRARKFDKDRAFKLIKNYYKTKTNDTTVFDDDKVVPSNVKEIVLDRNVLSVSPKRDPEGRVMLIFVAKYWKASEISLEVLLRALYLIVEKLLQDETVQVNGISAVLDLAGLSLQHIRQLHPMLAYLFISFVQDCLPGRLKAVHVVRENMWLDMGYAIIKPLLKPKLRKRISFHGHDLENLYKHIPKDHLPQEFGGTMGPIDNTDLSNLLLDSESEFIEDLQYGYVSTTS